MTKGTKTYQWCIALLLCLVQTAGIALNVIREYLLRSSVHPQNNKIYSKPKMRIFCPENTRIPQ